MLTYADAFSNARQAHRIQQRTQDELAVQLTREADEKHVIKLQEISEAKQVDIGSLARDVLKVCSRMLAYADVGSLARDVLNVCFRMLAHADVF
jgi:hypothetical protein